MNPHQRARIVGRHAPRVLCGEPSMINYLDALNAFELVREADAATGSPAAASFKHVSPAGAAVAGPVDETATAAWGIGAANPDRLLSAYVRARDADPRSSFGDVVALSRPVDVETARFLGTVVCDAVIAPAFESGALANLSAKRGGRFVVMEAMPDPVGSPWERRDVAGVTIEQERDTLDLAEMIPDDGRLDAGMRRDAVLGLITLRYTQSNSVAFVRDGAAIGVAAGQQSRVDGVRLAGAKSRVWWLRRHPHVGSLPRIAGMGRQERLNWQIRFAGREMTARQFEEFGDLFGRAAADLYSADWREEFAAELDRVTMSSDGYLPFRDNVDHAADLGVRTIVEPGGSLRTPEVARAAAEHGITHVQTGVRLFHH